MHEANTVVVSSGTSHLAQQGVDAVLVRSTRHNGRFL